MVTGCEVEASRSWVQPPGHGIMPWVRLVSEWCGGGWGGGVEGKMEGSIGNLQDGGEDGRQ